MKKFFYLSVFCVSALAACTGAFTKTKDGVEYKIISKGEGKTVGYGNYIQMHIKQIYNSGTKDTVLLDTREMMPRIQILDSVNTPLIYFQILSKMKKGDSLVLRTLTDSAFKRNMQEMPPFMKKGKYLYTLVKLVNIFETQQQADSASKAERIIAKPLMYKNQLVEIEKDLASKKQQLDIDDKLIKDYLTKNNIKAERTKWGTYIAINTEGAGEKLSTDNIASIKYTGRTLDSGKVFDSNIDPKFQHVEPLEVNLGQFGGIILGFPDALLQMKKGTKATVYIPSVLAYGTTGRGADIKPNDILVFDMDVTEVTTEEEAIAKQQALQDKMIIEQKRVADSLQKASKK
ncbi:MAG TPA: FKBP-type peptidyl-prolyl cis-trans isomerase [Ferruginibacter sp.]|nr:FKBP-type peptidyl-prolyl cis-trans isomerase [Ferruginibacter sp.]